MYLPEIYHMSTCGRATCPLIHLSSHHHHALRFDSRRSDNCYRSAYVSLRVSPRWPRRSGEWSVGIGLYDPLLAGSLS